jgi:hypothetical protein
MKPWKIPNRLPVINATLSPALHRVGVTLTRLSYTLELTCQRCRAPWRIEVLTTPLPRRWWRCERCGGNGGPHARP